MTVEYLEDGRNKTAFVNNIQSFFNMGTISYNCTVSTITTNGNNGYIVLAGSMSHTIGSTTNTINCRDTQETYDLYIIKENGTWYLYGNQANGYLLTGTGDSTGYITFAKRSKGAIVNNWSFDAEDEGGLELAYGYTGVDFDYFILTSPALNTTWTYSTYDAGYPIIVVNTITSVSDTITTAAGTFNNCVKVFRTFSYPNGYVAGFHQYQTTLKTDWFAPGVGLVRYDTTNADASSTSITLINYSVTGATVSDYFPLAVGDNWTYQSGENSWTLTVTSMNSGF